MTRIRVALLVTKPMAASIFDAETLAFLDSFAVYRDPALLPETVTAAYMGEELAEADACVTCWGTPAFTDALLDGAPRLRLIAHAAGSVKHLVCPTLFRRCRLVSNASVIAAEVAQTTLALLLSSALGLWQGAARTRAGAWGGGEAGAFRTRDLSCMTIGLIGASRVGREVIRLLRPFGCRILLSDPTLAPLEAEALDVELAPLVTLLGASDIVSLHAPAIESCRHMMDAAAFARMRDGAIFLNTARGMLVDEDALARELRSGRLYACLDVTDPEPPAPDHPFRTLPNVLLTPHIAGGHTVDCRRRLGRTAVLQIHHYFTKGVLQDEILPEMLDGMA